MAKSINLLIVLWACLCLSTKLELGSSLPLDGDFGPADEPVEIGEEDDEAPFEGSLECMICKQVAQWTIVELKDNKTEEAIVQALDQVCDRIFTAKQRPQCEAFVKQYSDEIISILKQENDPELICNLVGACDNVEANSVLKTEVLPEQGNGFVCEYCLKAAQWLDEQLNDNRTSESIIAALNQVCRVAVPKEKLSECEQYLQDKYDEIMDCLRNKDDPNAFCSNMKLCPPSDAPVAVLEPVVVSDEIADVDHEREEMSILPTCLACKQIMKYIHRELNGNYTDEAFAHALSKVCPVFYHHEAQCEAEMEKYAPRIIIALRQASDPELACQLLMVCAQVEDMETVAVEQSDMKSCLECKTFAKLLQTELRKRNKQEEMDDWFIQNICDRTENAQVKQTCVNYVRKYGPQIIVALADEAFDPKMLCEKTLKMCPAHFGVDMPLIPETSEELIPESPKVEFELLQPLNAEKCDTCVEVVRTLDTLLGMDLVEKDIAHFATRVCDLVSGDRQAQCRTMIQVYGPYFLQMIGRLGNPRKVCKSIDMCFISGEDHLLGGHKCTFGPTYWCHTSAHAEACKATDFCQRQIWSAVE
ncbi:Prosaposin [Halotydeus destructor]|nr:Prosaposin [Halotydeus destructor]